MLLKLAGSCTTRMLRNPPCSECDDDQLFEETKVALPLFIQLGQQDWRLAAQSLVNSMDLLTADRHQEASHCHEGQLSGSLNAARLNAMSADQRLAYQRRVDART